LQAHIVRMCCTIIQSFLPFPALTGRPRNWLTRGERIFVLWWVMEPNNDTSLAEIEPRKHERNGGEFFYCSRLKIAPRPKHSRADMKHTLASAKAFKRTITEKMQRIGTLQEQKSLELFLADLRKVRQGRLGHR
jgi:hypothetical protein